MSKSILDTIREVKLYLPNYDDPGFIQVSHKVLDTDKIINIVEISKNSFFPGTTLGKVTIDNKEIDTSKTFGELNIKAGTKIYIEIKEFSNPDKNKITDDKKKPASKKKMRKAKPISKENKTDPLENYIEYKLEVFDKPKKKLIPLFEKNKDNKLFKAVLEDFKEDYKISIEPNLGKNTDLYNHGVDEDDEDIEISENYNDCVVVYINGKETTELKENDNGYGGMCHVFDKVGIYTVKIGFKKKMETISYLFCDCCNIIELDMTHLNIDEIVEMTGLFRDCQSLKKINFNIDTSKIKSFNSLFGWCYNLEKIEGIEDFKTENGEDFSKMFARVYSIKELDISKWNIKNLKKSVSTFEEAYGIEVLKVNEEINKKIIKKENSYFPPTIKVEIVK